MQLECTFPECGRPVLAKDLCQTHYQMQRRGEELRPIRYQHGAFKFRPCAGPECDRHANSRWGSLRICAAHYDHLKRGGTLKPLGRKAKKTGPCTFEGCDRPIKSRDYCQGHYRQWRLGKELKPLHVPSYRYEFQGYVLLIDPSHPNAQASGKILEHVKVMSETLGRPLQPGETVHHKNGIRNDNRPENLELRSGRHGKHQRVTDLLQHAREILATYGTDEEKRAIKKG